MERRRGRPSQISWGLSNDVSLHILASKVYNYQFLHTIFILNFSIYDSVLGQLFPATCVSSKHQRVSKTSAYLLVELVGALFLRAYSCNFVRSYFLLTVNIIFVWYFERFVWTIIIIIVLRFFCVSRNLGNKERWHDILRWIICIMITIQLQIKRKKD